MMHNWYAMESEAEFRRLEWERAVAADTRAALAGPARVTPRWLHLPMLSLSGLNLRRLAGPGLSFTAPLASRQSATCETSPSV
jgi:hypothetical protein